MVSSRLQIGLCALLAGTFDVSIIKHKIVHIPQQSALKGRAGVSMPGQLEKGAQEDRPLRTKFWRPLVTLESNHMTIYDGAPKAESLS